MTKNSNFKRRVRARVNKTGESYTAALRQIRGDMTGIGAPDRRSVRLAVAQTSACEDPGDTGRLRMSGREIRSLMHAAHDAGARLVHFPEGAICSPGKRIMSELGPRDVGPADWSRANWVVLREELDATRQLARDLGLWTVLGSVHQLSGSHRPHNSLYVISGSGELETRYDERMLSHTKISYMYTPGSIPLTFVVDGVRFGLALGMEVHYPEIFVEYEGLDVDCVLFSTTGGTCNDAGFAAEALGHAASNTCWVSFALQAQNSPTAPSGIASPAGRWAAHCLDDGRPSIALADIATDPDNLARPWRRKARSGIYEPHRVDDDPRSSGRTRI